MKTHLYFLEILVYYVIHQNDCLVFDTSNLDSSVKVTESQTAIVKFRYRFESNDDRAITPKIICGYEDNGLRILVTKTATFTVTAGSDVSLNLRSRISLYTESDEVVGFSISRVQLTDPRNYRCTAAFTKNIGNSKEIGTAESSIVILEIYRYGQNISLSRDFTATLNQDLTLSWTFSGEANFEINSLTLYKDSARSANKIYEGKPSTELTATGKAVLGERYVIEKIDLAAGVFITKLKKVQFKDTGRNFIFRVIYENGRYDDLNSTYTITKVLGGPTTCHDPLNSFRIYTFNENQSPEVSLKFCGVPKPMIHWTFNSREINSGTFSQQSSSIPYSFKYDVKLPRLTQNLCGKTLTYSASGHSGNNVLQGSSKVFINFQPSVIENIAFFEEFESCNSVTWKALDVGDCSVTYTVEYLNSTGASILTVTGITSQRDCNPKSKNASSVRVWAVSGDRIGVIGEAVTLTSINSASVGKTETGNVVDNFGVIVFIVSGVLVIIIVSVFVVVFYKANLKYDNKRCVDRTGEKELKKLPKHQNEGYYAVINDNPLNQLNPNESIYTELDQETSRILSVDSGNSDYEVMLIREEFI